MSTESFRFVHLPSLSFNYYTLRAAETTLYICPNPLSPSKTYWQCWTSMLSYYIHLKPNAFKVKSHPESGHLTSPHVIHSYHFQFTMSPSVPHVLSFSSLPRSFLLPTWFPLLGAIHLPDLSSRIIPYKYLSLDPHRLWHHSTTSLP